MSHRRRTPSFSSSLLDSIYRSIDGESYGQEEEEEQEFNTLCREKSTVKEATAISAMKSGTEDKERKNLRRAMMIESWMDKRSTNCGSVVYSTSSSSDSSSGGGVFSSSDAESSYYCRRKPRSSSSSTQRMQFQNRIDGDNKQTKQKREGGGGGGGFTKNTKLRALKIYGELKKVKQPISPGGRIASFFTSIFSSGNAKKVKICSDQAAMEDVSFNDDHCKPKSTCSSTTPFSRSCLSKTPSKLTDNGMKRSVRFYPVSVIVDEDCRPYGQKFIHEQDDPSLLPKIVKSSAVKQELMKGMDYLTSYQKRNVDELDCRRFGNYIDNDADGEDDDDDDAESCSSSDLFELDHLIGIGRYREELPVYETTNLKTNQAIANGFIL
ncbi:corepressor interacting with RBPJ 1-like [Tripterygium wilfordii]|uniref:Corepressor interacting with RBPJ 1-like n=1 Tax=Tripterygium wilfordii TaxID=458696 RepID=A0A7J7D9N5_TRIWF|nr:protein BIG GRAIN 1-like C [Tripterygium wilfordii]KAF5743075.1 corepressor interacting with RBPJ 1-like [Tripterygium wilfordii]